MGVRRWRLLMAVFVLWVMIYLYINPDNTPVLIGSAPYDGPASSQRPNGGKIHWVKLPERYPVESPRPLPSGALRHRIPSVQRQPSPLQFEDKAARRTREDRLAAVKESFRHSWAGYKKNAWLSDEVLPLTGERSDPFAGWAATLVDALDTLWIMGLKDDFKDAVKACEKIDFTTTLTVSINLFETTIRYLGGFLAAYELSGMQYQTLLLKAVEVAELIMCAFDTPNRFPITRWDWQRYLHGNAQVAPKAVLVAEVGSLSLEFTKLSQLTGDNKYYDAIQRISDAFEESQSSTQLPGMWPVVVDASKPSFDSDNGFTLGGMSDSLYEYFPKQYLILGGLLEQPRQLYENFIEVAKKHMFRRAMNPHNIPIVISGDVRVSIENSKRKITNTPRSQHLTCFAGGMVGLAARIFSRESDMDLARQLTDSCVWMYSMTATGIGPEIFSFAACGGIEESQTGEKCRYSDVKWRAALREYWRPNRTGKELSTEEEMRVLAEVEELIEYQRLPPGILEVNDRKYVLRPEAIESVFVMWRITGDSVWMDKAWNMFLAIETYTRTDIAAASLDDVTKTTPGQVNSMESFWLAETLKYFFLIYSDWDTVNLDQWVLNTEAHPLKRPEIST